MNDFYNFVKKCKIAKYRIFIIIKISKMKIQ